MVSGVLMSMWTPALFYKYPDAYRSVFLKVWFFGIPSAGIHLHRILSQRIKDKGGLISFITLHVASANVQQKNTNKMCRGSDYQRREYYEGSTKSYSGYH